MPQPRHDDDTQPMPVPPWRPTEAGPRRTFDPAYDRALASVFADRTGRTRRQQRVGAEVARILDGVAHEFRMAPDHPPARSTPWPPRDAGQEELARGIGTAAIVLGIGLLIVVVLVFGFFGAGITQ